MIFNHKKTSIHLYHLSLPTSFILLDFIEFILSQPPSQSVHIKPNYFGRLFKWFVELYEFDTSYTLWMTIKSQALVGFLVIFSEGIYSD